MNQTDYPSLLSLVQTDELWSVVRDFDKLQAGAQSTKRLSELEEGDVADIARELNTLAFEHYHIMLVFRLKTKELARGIFASLLEENYVVLFNLARAFMEHTASLAYQNEALQKAVNELKGQQDTDRIKNLIVKSRNAAQRLYYGGDGSPASAQRINVNDMLKALYNIYDNAAGHYKLLCEFVHPNWGSNTLVSSGILASGEIGTQPDRLIRELQQVRDVIERCAHLDSEMLVSGTHSLLQLSDWVSLASKSKVKASHIFSFRSAHGGDGLSKETAIFFSKARTHHEAIEAFYAYIQAEDLEFGKRRQICVENGWMFDIVATDKRTFWVKYRLD